MTLLIVRSQYDVRPRNIKKMDGFRSFPRKEARKPSIP
ncbi:hypothetical protein BIFADO_01586 [Bifidobacterium adolescentis L2-32]|uniref:Uncharacterized protein n=1 Tax=Bifidobacterium adolescentis L2-32 TaxID=411481 RepID=A7A6V3_BIFAD|nr:hypothetical protein BIFADO_01586 [Bifidobacterium adolescentis L2-32]DAM02900.1 MAG TPA: hypothetical protein [Caudoviricetes sp.]